MLYLIKLYIDIAVSKYSALSAEVLLVYDMQLVNNANFLKTSFLLYVAIFLAK